MPQYWKNYECSICCIICNSVGKHFETFCPEKCKYCSRYHKTEEHLCMNCNQYGKHSEINCPLKFDNKK